ncbi:MAG TPA: PDZ domain-containing protein [Gemmatimonadales bacterium]|nr:PDZ domain-containing protein [Gemmatimonadales bacterium]
MNRKWMVVLTAVALGLPGTLRAQETPAPAPAPRAAPRVRVNTREGPFSVYTFSGNHARLGVVVNQAANADSDKLGARIVAVTPGGPAEKAGLQAGDVITKFNGTALANATSEDEDMSGPGNKLIELARALDPGDTVKVEYRRGTATKQATVIAQELGSGMAGGTPMAGRMELTVPPMSTWREFMPDMPRTPEMNWESGNINICMGDSWCSLELVTLNSDLGEYFGTKDGVLVVRAPNDSTLPVKGGDVIVAIGGRKPTSPSHAMRILRSYDTGETVQIDVMRHQKRVTLSWTVPNPESQMRKRMERARPMREHSEQTMWKRMPRMPQMRKHAMTVI